MADLPKAPAKDIKDPTKRIGIAHEIYEEVLQLGYDYGRDSSEEDRAWEF